MGLEVWVYVVVVILIVVLVARNNNNVGSRAIIAAPSAANVSGVLFRGTQVELSGGATGARRALVFGLNYVGSPYRLYGCIQDAANVATALRAQGFTVDIVTDSTAAKPTRATMVSKITAFLSSLSANDVGFLWYSGHGTMSGGANALVPTDFQISGLLLETTLIPFVSRMPLGARLFMGSDSCYSGSMLNLKFDVEPSGSTASRGSRGGTRGGPQIPRDVQRVVPTDMPEPLDQATIERVVSSLIQNYALYDTGKPVCKASVAYISGCRDNQTSADAFVDGQSQGAMTWAFIRALRSMPNVPAGTPKSLGLLQDLMRAALQGRYSQVPQLSVGSSISPFSPLSHFALAALA